MSIRTRLTTIASLKTRIGTAETGDDAFFDDLIDQASAWFLKRTRGRSFVPYYQARQFRVGSVELELYPRGIRYVGLQTLLLDEDLLSVTTFTNGDADDTAITSDQYALLPLNTWPKEAIELNSDSGVSYEFENSSSVVTVAGLWGYHDDYPRAWASASTLSAGVNASVTTWPVADGTQYAVGDYLLSDTEIARVTAIASNNLTVLRGVNGTTAAAHDSAAAVKVYQFVYDVQAAVERLAVFWYQNRDSVESSVQIAELAVRLESKIPGDVWETIDAYKKVGFYAVG